MKNIRSVAATSLAGLAIVALSACQAPATTPAPAGSTAKATSASATTSSASASKSSASASATGSASASKSGSTGATMEAKTPTEFGDMVTAGMKGVKTFKISVDGMVGSSAGAGQGKATYDVDQSNKDQLKTHGTVSGGAVAIETITDGADAYVKQPSGKWKKAAVQEQDLNFLQVTLGDQFKKAKDIKKVGTEKIDGTDATHYQLTFPAGVIGNSEATMDVWVDGTFRPLQQKMDADIQGARLTTTTKVTDIDKPVDIKVPAASDIEG